MGGSRRRLPGAGGKAVRPGPGRLCGAIYVALVLALLGGCSDESEAEPEVQDRVTTSSTSTTSVASDDYGTQALKVWDEFLVVSQEWRNPPNPAHPRIPDFIAADAVEDFRKAIAVEFARDTARRPAASGPPAHKFSVRSSSSLSVVIEDCFVDDFVAYNFRTGEVIDEAVATRTLEVELVKESGAWKIERIREVNKVDGRAECDA